VKADGEFDLMGSLTLGKRNIGHAIDMKNDLIADG
jgi:hypothetical protein